MIVKTEAIVLNARKFGDSSRIAVLFTKEYGILSALAKGAYQPKSKFGASIEPIGHTLVTFYKKPGADLHLLSTSELVNPFIHIRSSLECMASALMILESVSQTQINNEPNSDLFSVLCSALESLNANCEYPFSVFSAFQVKLAELLGFAMDFQFPFNPDETQPNIMFSIENGSFIAINNISRTNCIRICRNTFNFLRELEDIDFPKAAQTSFDAGLWRGLLDLFVLYFNYHTEKRISYKAFNLLKV